MRPTLVLVSLLSLVCACEAPGTSLARSCGGARVLECDPYEWSVVTAASFTPEVPIGDPRVRPRIEVTLETCGASTPAAADVQIQAIIGPVDGGMPSRVVEVATVHAEEASSTAIDVTIDNPFSLGSGVPDDETILLRFTPIVAGCDGDSLSIPYRTGPLVRP
jgi:hypothetical protein